MLQKRRVPKEPPAFFISIFQIPSTIFFTVFSDVSAVYVPGEAASAKFFRDHARQRAHVGATTRDAREVRNSVRARERRVVFYLFLISADFRSAEVCAKCLPRIGDFWDGVDLGASLVGDLLARQGFNLGKYE